MSIADLFKQSEYLVKENSSAILTAIGVTGTVTTAVLTGRSTVKAVRLIDELENVRTDGGEWLPEERPSATDVAKFVWPLYIPPAGVGVATIVSIIMANRLSSKKAAALAAAYGISERAFQEYKEKVVEKLGENKARDIRDEIAQERVAQHPTVSSQVIITGANEVLCFDLLTGRYFKSSVEQIRRAENDINAEIFRHEYASLSQFYDKLGLDATQFSDEVGWNHDNICEVQISTVRSPDDQPAIAVNFAIGPVPNYNKLY